MTSELVSGSIPTLRHVALVQSQVQFAFHVSVVDERFEVLFRPGGSRILDSRGDLVCIVVPEGQIFRADFSQSSGVDPCFSAGLHVSCGGGIGSWVT
jgi:hypothetical protein